MLENKGFMLEKSCENIFFFGGRPGGGRFLFVWSSFFSSMCLRIKVSCLGIMSILCIFVLFAALSLFSSMCLRIRVSCIFFGWAVEELFFGIVLVLTHMLENKGFMLETKALLKSFFCGAFVVFENRVLFRRVLFLRGGPYSQACA